MPYIARGLGTYYEKHQEYPKDIALRKHIIKDWYITRLIASIEKCIADKSRIFSDTTTNIYRERKYEPDYIVPDNLPLEEPFKESGWLSDTGLTEYIYYNSSISRIYHLKHLEYIKGYQQQDSLSLLELIYPAKMPTKDYFPFVEFDIGAEIPLVLTEEERQRGHDSSIRISNWFDIESFWCFCIIWIDEHRMFMSLDDTFCYFKQIGKNVHLFELVLH